MKTIGFIGLGTMGLPMAVNLLKQGYPVTVYNRTIEKAEQLRNMGANVAASPSEAARSVDVLFTMLSDDRSLNEVYYGANGIMEGLHPNLTVIDCSTVSPALSRSICKDLADHGASFLDAPVTGSKPAAIDGTLLFMVGGDKTVMDEQLDLFDTLGKKVLYMGPSGSGSQTKLAHNTIVGINIAAFSEGMSIAAKAGIDVERFVEIVLGGAANSRQAELKGDKILNRDFSNQFSLQLMLKDLNLSTELSSQLQLPTPLLQTARSLFQMAYSKGYGPEDLSSVVRCYEEWMNLEIGRKTASADNETAASLEPAERRKSQRIPMNIKLQLSVYQWEKEGSFSGQTIEGVLYDLSNGGLQIVSDVPLAQDMFVVIHFPQEAGLPPITGKIIRVEVKEGSYRYGCMLSGLPPYIRIQLEQYIETH